MAVEISHRLTRAALLILCPLLAASCASRDVDQYVGKDPYTTFPVGEVVDQSLMQLNDAHPDADWGLSLVWMGDHYLLTADENVIPGGLSQSWRVRAVQRIPLLKYGEMFALGSCETGGKALSRVVAVVRYDHTEQWFDQITSAWVYRAGMNAFLAYPTQELRCRNPLYGTDLTPAAPPFAAPPAGTSPSAARPPRR